MSAIQIAAKVENGHVNPKARKLIADMLNKYEGKHIVIKIGRMLKRRSSPQNRYYWGVCVKMVTQMSLDAGNETDKQETHELLKRIGGITKEIYDRDGVVIDTITNSSTKLTTTQFNDWMEKIRAWAAQYDLIIPLPNEILPTDEQFLDEPDITI